VVIKANPPDVAPFVETARGHADRERDALGFLPAAVYDDAAARGNLLIALISRATSQEYAGHLLFGGTFPYARIFQVFVCQQYRNQGVARELIEYLVKLLEHYGYLSAAATVADDLIANGFWEKLGFLVARQKPGGVSRKRLLNVRIKQLDSPNLFQPQFPSTVSDLGLIEPLGTHTAVYAIDLNVFWDVVKRRPRSEYAADVIGAAFNRLIQIVVAQEFITELQRTTTTRPDLGDPALEFALQFPTLPQPDGTLLKQLQNELGDLIFPGRSKSGTLTLQDQSDLVHLATAIHHGATGFVTSDDALLGVRDLIYKKHGISVLHVREFAALVKSAEVSVPPLAAQLSSDTLRIWDSISADSVTIKKFLDDCAAPTAFRDDFVAKVLVTPTRKRMIVTSESDIVCLASWDACAGLQNRAHVNLVANEDNPAAEAAIDCILGIICTQASWTRPVLMQLCLPQGHVIARKIARAHGFRANDSTAEGDLQKICVGRPIHVDNWAKMQTTFHHYSGIDFPDALPAFTSYNQEVPFRTKQGISRNVKLSDLENLLSPTLIILPGRSGNIVPIRRIFADQLLGASRQLSLLPKREASLFSERIYFSASRNASLFRAGTPLLFYESGRTGGSASVTACARVVQTTVLKKIDISAHLLRHGVLESEDLKHLTANDSICVTTFDNIMHLEHPVPLDRLRELGCVDASNLVCPRQIGDQQLVSLLREGFSTG
jgi:GNAT superfamily N-acetyltransferase/predicted nucleic acid-binding protein